MISDLPKPEPDSNQAFSHEKRGQIHLGDLVMAIHTLNPINVAEWEWLFQCLGFQFQDSKTETPSNYKASRAAWNRPLLNHSKTVTNTPPSYRPPISMPPVFESISTDPKDMLEADMEIETVEQGNYSLVLPAEILNSENLSAEISTPAPLRQTLFPNKTARGLVSVTVTQPIPGKNLDVRKLIQSLVAQKPLKTLPTLSQNSIRNGCQLLLDFSDALMPWWEDMQSLILQFQEVLGKALCPVYEFSDNPSEAISWLTGAGVSWQPVANKPVVVATDLGIIQGSIGQSSRSGKAEWQNFISVCSESLAPVIILFPLHPQRCPYELDKLATLIHWHPTTSAAMIKRISR